MKTLLSIITLVASPLIVSASVVETMATPGPRLSSPNALRASATPSCDNACAKLPSFLAAPTSWEVRDNSSTDVDFRNRQAHTVTVQNRGDDYTLKIQMWERDEDGGNPRKSGDPIDFSGVDIEVTVPGYGYMEIYDPADNDNRGAKGDLS